ncbi:50S ribosomal protein L3 N(5)-glutamine methyltransferase [Arhodomonas aquaeolei]|uniref:50S ribosomal protein L3 N(5)-glutamine methyltransferase n=1 Tax=Arhodomonas aquaeolei TaxID=2369 RepID=UPI0021684C02|nr:50S ribosomal protein L3 N(5)-glutamine methyltransferase [Arhodomonas aquaeolei]MCS4504408.1 50S ribosomal protein L3 N(5)-glutamine methyltransferase [Arhodomonas aquaeolei]
MSDANRVPPELETIADFVRWGASRFEAAGVCYGHGTDNAIDEAAALVLHTLHLPPDTHDAYLGCRLTGEEKAAIVARVHQRVEQRLPLPYITHEAWFAGLAFYVDERVLIPRSPVAELIEAGFQPWADPDEVTRIADVGTGSGCIAIACALALPGCEVDALDISEDALAVARINADRHGVRERVHAHASDLLAGTPAEPAYDVIVANPPYVDAPAMDALPEEYRHEPRMALAAGEDGLDYVHRLLVEATARLTDDGVLVCEVGHSAPAMEAAYPDLPLTWLAFERGGVGVFVVTAAALRAALAAGHLNPESSV